MNYRHPLQLAVFLVALCLGSLVCVRSGAAEEVHSLDMAQLRTQLEAAKGKVVLLNFFATWCPPCREEIPALVRLRGKFSADKVLLIGIGVDDKADTLERFVQEYGIQYPVVTDAGDLSQGYRVSSIPHNIIYDKTGKLAVSHVGIVNESELERFITRLLAE